MTDRGSTGQSEHERRVAEETAAEADTARGDENETTGLPDPAPGETGATPYEREIAIEQRGERPSEVEADVSEDERNPLDSGYRPKSG
jgi:hypothetical protein